MSMVTQCPHCMTAFNVTPEQLFARDGRVRCGQCRQVFDGLVHLTSLEALEAGVPPPLAEPSAAKVQTRAESMMAGERAAPTPRALTGFSPAGWPMVPDVPEVPVPPPPRAATSASMAALIAPAPNESDKAPVRQPRRWARRGWAMAAALATFVLGGQALFAFRSEIAAHFPQTRPALVQLCGWMRCSVPPLQRPSALAIQASDLLILDKDKPHLVQLIVTMQNQSGVEVGYPAIDLVLNDRFEHAVARRVFVPADYLNGADVKKTGIAASVTTTVRINLDLSELSAGGYGLLLIPAPQS